MTKNYEVQNTIGKVRNINLDLIRFAGVLIIMVAHSNPPGWLFQLRNFGTPLLILGSALTYSFIYRHKSIDSGPFIKKRLKRLIFPLWIFLTFFFLFFWITSLLVGKHFPFSTMEVIHSYDLYNGIGFVWIFKVYIILALITPLGLKLSKSAVSNKTYFLSIILVYILYELGMYLFFDLIPLGLKDFVTQYFLIIIPYTVLYLYGLRLYRFSTKTLCFVIAISLLVFSLLVMQKYTDLERFVPTQMYKYPPTLYYLAYAFFWINLIYLLVTRYVDLTKEKVQNTIIWLSANSLWIYLWHIFASYLWQFLLESIFETYFQTVFKFVIKALFLLIFGIVMAYIQLTFVNRLLLRTQIDSSSNKLLVFLK